MISVPHRPQHQPTVVGCGFVALDVVLHDDWAVQYAGVGGTVGNVMSIMAFLGWRSVPVVRLGADPAGAQVLQELVSLGVDTSQIVLDKRVKTPVVYQRNAGQAGHHSFSFRCPHCGQARRFSEQLLEGIGTQAAEPLAQRGDVYFFDRLTSRSVEMAEQAKVNGALTVFEPSAVGQDTDLFERALHASHIVKYSAERLADWVMPVLGAGFVEIQTLGAAGLRFRMRSLDPSWVTLPAFRAGYVIDTAGSGDWCTAGLLHIMSGCLPGGMLSDLGYNKIHSALRAGQLMAALNCQHTGARGLMRHVSAQPLRELLFTVLERDALSCQSSLELDWFIRDAVGARSPTEVATHEAQAALPLCCDAIPSLRSGPALFH